MSLMNDFIQLLTCNVDEFTKWLEEHHNVPKDSVIEKLNDLTGLNLSNENDSVVCADIQDPEITIQRSGTTVPYLCQYVFKIGTRKGQQCTKKPKDMATYCSSHKEKEKKESGEEKPKKKNKNVVQKTPKSKEFVDTSEDEETPKKSKSKKAKKPKSDSDSD